MNKSTGFYLELYNALEKITLKKTGKRDNRLNFETHRKATFGLVRERFSGKFNISLYSRKYPDIYNMLLLYGEQFVKHDFTSIHVIKNLTSPKHKDTNNVGVSTLVSFGFYSGSKIVIEGEEYDAFENPISFNGFEKEHYNTNDLEGNKYSIIYFSINYPTKPKYIVAIPSYKRNEVLKNQTLKMLLENGIPREIINIFVVKEQYELYKSSLNNNLYNKLIIGELGLVQQREFIINYYHEGINILFLDDDIKKVDLSLTEYTSLDNFINSAFDECRKENVYMFSVNPVYNPFWREKKLSLKKTNLNYCIGAFYGIINRKINDIKLKICVEGNKEDVERSILYFLKDGKTLVYNRIGFVTKYFGNDGGGLGNLKSRIPISMKNSKLLCDAYGDICKEKIRKNGLYEVVFKKI